MDLQTEKTLAKLLEEFERSVHSLSYMTASRFPVKQLAAQRAEVNRKRQAIFTLLNSPKQ